MKVVVSDDGTRPIFRSLGFIVAIGGTTFALLIGGIGGLAMGAGRLRERVGSRAAWTCHGFFEVSCCGRCED